MYPTSLEGLQRFQVVYYDIYKRVKNTSCRRNARCSSLYKQCIFRMYLQKKRDSFLKFLCTSWGLFVTEWLPSCLRYASSLLLKLPSTAIKIDKMNLKTTNF